MKKFIKKAGIQLMLMMLTIITATNILFAQDGGANSTTTTTTQSTSVTIQPWMWVVGGAVFILILVALLRGGRKDSVTVDRTTTIERNDV